MSERVLHCFQDNLSTHFISFLRKDPHLCMGYKEKHKWEFLSGLQTWQRRVENRKLLCGLEQLLPLSHLFSNLPGDLLTQQSQFLFVCVPIVNTLGLKQSKSQPMETASLSEKKQKQKQTVSCNLSSLTALSAAPSNILILKFSFKPSLVLTINNNLPYIRMHLQEINLHRNRKDMSSHTVTPDKTHSLILYRMTEWDKPTAIQQGVFWCCQPPVIRNGQWNEHIEISSCS